MNRSARVIVTFKCNRKCPFCCNQFLEDIPQIYSVKELLEYSDIVITGGEPMLIAARVVEMIHQLQALRYEGNIWLYTARLNVDHWAERTVLKEVKGITYTLHNEVLHEDLKLLKRLNEYIKNNLDNSHNSRSDRLLVDSRIYTNLDVLNTGVFNGSHWSKIRSLQWKTEECPIPENEDLLFYDLESI